MRRFDLITWLRLLTTGMLLILLFIRILDKLGGLFT